MPSADTPKQGLRELKKARTRNEIQRQALRLFLRQGYAATTVEQIAAAAEVSQSTFFRYFGTKEDVVLWDDYDPRFVAALRAQPAHLPPIAALRHAMHALFADLSAEELALQQERGLLIQAEPDLLARSLTVTLESVKTLTAALAERLGREPTDFALRNLVGAVFGAMFTAWLTMAEQPEPDMAATMDAALEHLEQGLPL